MREAKAQLVVVMEVSLMALLAAHIFTNFSHPENEQL